MKYGLIAADPAWQYGDSGVRGGTDNHYSSMPLQDIYGLGPKVQAVASTDCVLLLWGTWPLVQEALGCFALWGFKFKTCAFVWVKANKRAALDQGRLFADETLDPFWGAGHWTRANTEFCLLGVRGKPVRADAGVHQVIYSEVSRHSEKPAEFYARAEQLLGSVPRLEMFARSTRTGWDAWGNEVVNGITL